MKEIKSPGRVVRNAVHDEVSYKTHNEYLQKKIVTWDCLPSVAITLPPVQSVSEGQNYSRAFERG